MKIRTLTDYLKLIQISKREFCMKTGIQQSSFMRTYNNIDNLKIEHLKQISEGLEIKMEKLLFDLTICGNLESNSHNSEKTENCKNDSKNDNFSEFSKFLTVMEN